MTGAANLVISVLLLLGLIVLGRTLYRERQISVHYQVANQRQYELIQALREREESWRRLLQAKDNHILVLRQHISDLYYDPTDT